MAIEDELLGFVAAVSAEGVPGSVRERVRALLADALVCLLAGSGSADAGLARVLIDVSAGASTTVFGIAERASWADAAFANGVAVRCLELNDTYVGPQTLHPSDFVPALLAVAESRGSSGEQLTGAVAVAYELMARLCAAREIHDRGWDSLTLGGLALSVATAYLCEFDREQTSQAIRLGAVLAPTMLETRAGRLSRWKNYSSAQVARTAVLAARAAGLGISGPVGALDAPHGLQRLVTGPLPSIVGLRGWELLSVSVKSHACQIFTQPAVDAALAARAELGPGDAIVEISVRTHSYAVQSAAGPERWHPTSAETADHSLPYCVAAALVYGQVMPEQFSAQSLADPAIHRLLGLMRVTVDPALTARFPAEQPCALELRLGDGTRRSYVFDRPRADGRSAAFGDEAELKLDRVLGWALGGGGRVLAARKEISELLDSPDLSRSLPALNQVLLAK
jgi:2-methylcitrate dehydratase